MIHPDDSLVTDRLSLRRFTLADLDLLNRLATDSRVMEFLGGVKDRAATEMTITNLANTPSQQVWLKAGLRHNGERRFEHPAYADQGPMAWFEL